MLQQRLTKQKKLLWEFLEACEGPMSAEMILRHLGDEMSRATVYRLLKAWVEEGKLREIFGRGQTVHYEKRQNDSGSQHFFVCDLCKLWKRIDVATPHCSTKEFAKELPKGHCFLRHETFFYGTCDRCEGNFTR